jgi:uncharacterized protein (TIGR03790 family)
LAATTDVHVGRPTRGRPTPTVLLAAVLTALQVTLALAQSPVGLTARDLAVVINTADPLSVAIGEYYAQQRHVPAANVARVHFGYHRVVLPAREFAALKAAIDAQLPSSVQAYALTWTQPYRVDCMSVTSAFAFGFDQRYCASGCVATQLSRYFNSASRRPFDDLQLRPAMSIAAANFEQARALILRGVAADATAPEGTAYLLTSGDQARDVRASTYADAQMLAGASASSSSMPQRSRGAAT